MDRCFVHYDDEDEGEERSVVNFEEEDGVHGETMEGLWIGLQGVLKRLDAGVIKTFRFVSFFFSVPVHVFVLFLFYSMLTQVMVCVQLASGLLHPRRNSL